MRIDLKKIKEKIKELYVKRLLRPIRKYYYEVTHENINYVKDNKITKLLKKVYRKDTYIQKKFDCYKYKIRLKYYSLRREFQRIIADILVKYAGFVRCVFRDNEVIRKEDAIYLDGDYFHPDDIAYCEKCGRAMYVRDICYDERGRILCTPCYSKTHIQCVNCGEWHRTDDMEYIDEGWNACGWYCLDCCSDLFYWDDNNQVWTSRPEIKSYHSHSIYDYKNNKLGIINDTEQALIKENKIKLYGFELEFSQCEDCFQYLSNEDLVYVLEQDSSLTSGVEIITYPMTRNYITNKFFDILDNDIYKALYDNCPDFNELDAGFHIHFNHTNPTDYEDINFKMRNILINSREDEDFILELTQRSSWYDIDEYATFKKLDNYDSNWRNQALRWDNRTDTFELRIFASSVCKDRIKANIEFFWALEDYIEETSFDEIKNEKRNLKDVLKYLINHKDNYPIAGEVFEGLYITLMREKATV